MYRVTRMYHNSQRVPDLAEAEAFFNRVFGREVIPMLSRFPTPFVGFEDYPRDYAFYVPIGDMLHDCIDPAKYVVDRVQRYPSVTEPRLKGLGWGVDDGIDELYFALVEAGIRCTDQADRPADTAVVPRASFSISPEPPQLFFTVPEDTGLRYEFYVDYRIADCHPLPGGDWVMPPRVENDPLTIDFLAYHTILTKDVARQARLLVDVLGGQIIHEQENVLRGTHSTYVGLVDAVYELATPLDDDSYEHRLWTHQAPADTYFAMTWRVRDLDAVRDHIGRCGLRIQAEDETTLIVEPAEALNVPWGFTTSQIPNDQRVPPSGQL